MHNYIYLLALLVSFFGVLGYDLRTHKNILKGKSVFTPILCSFVFLLIADCIGIYLDVFHTNPLFVSGWYIITPDLPVEEIILLLFLPYLTIVLTSVFTKRT